VRGFKIDRRGAIAIQRTFPARDAHAPFIARLQSGEAPFRARRDQIVSIEHGEVEEFPRDFHADRMQPKIFRPGPTKAVAIKAGERIAATTFEFGSQDVSRHRAILTLETEFVKCWIVENARGETGRALQA
jgi:hypothetical protein